MVVSFLEEVVVCVQKDRCISFKEDQGRTSQKEMEKRSEKNAPYTGIQTVSTTLYKFIPIDNDILQAMRRDLFARLERAFVVFFR